MIPIGFATIDHLRRMQLRGYGPEDAHDAIKSEAMRRYPQATSIILQAVNGGWAILALVM